MGVDANGCWMGNWCQDMTLGELPSNPTSPFLNLCETQFKVAALTSPWSARGASWRRRRLWLTALKGNSSPLDPAQTMAPRMDLTMAQSMDLTMASTMAQALTKN